MAVEKKFGGSVIVTGDSKHPGAGFFEAAIAPLVVNNPAAGLQNSHRLASLTDSDFDYRMSLSQKLDAGFQNAFWPRIRRVPSTSTLMSLPRMISRYT